MGNCCLRDYTNDIEYLRKHHDKDWGIDIYVYDLELQKIIDKQNPEYNIELSKFKQIHFIFVISHLCMGRPRYTFSINLENLKKLKKKLEEVLQTTVSINYNNWTV